MTSKVMPHRTNLRRFYVQAKIGREKDCEVALQRLRGENANISLEVAEIRVSFKLCERMIL